MTGPVPGGGNNGVIISGVHGSTIGPVSNSVGSTLPDLRAGAGPHAAERADLGILTVLSQETAAVVAMLRRGAGYTSRQLPDRSTVHEAYLGPPSRPVRTVAMQTVDRGQRSMAVAYHQLRRHFSPPIVALIGIAGGINPTMQVGDVVVASTVIHYDARRETDQGARHRGSSATSSARILRALNDFFSTRGEPCPLVVPGRTGRPFLVRRGPIGTGEAVITYQGSPIRDYLNTFNEKVLAVETEAGGLTQAFAEEYDSRSDLDGWLVVRGVSDNADQHKGYADHELAAAHAARTFEELVPFL
ncbi:5'-methylthioadenosine/S-adenosylhomocysteine nucleosidase family protein [Longispora urticae]